MQQGCERTRENMLRALSMVARYGGLPLVAVLLAACSSDETGGDRRSGTADNHPPVIKSAVILPTPVVLSGPVTVSVDAQDLDGDGGSQPMPDINRFLRHPAGVNPHDRIGMPGPCQVIEPIDFAVSQRHAGVTVRRECREKDRSPDQGRIHHAPFRSQIRRT